MTGTVNSSEDTWPGGSCTVTHTSADPLAGRIVGFHPTGSGVDAHVSGDPEDARYVTTAPLVTAGPVAAPTSYCQRP